MLGHPGPDRIVSWCLWSAAALMAAGAAAVVAASRGGDNRIAIAALPFGVAAAALAANALSHRRSRALAGVLYALSGLAITYGMVLGLSVPLRLAVEGSCQPAPAPCPLGFDRPLTGAESAALEVAIACAVLALLLSALALEVKYRPRLFRLLAPLASGSRGESGSRDPSDPATRTGG
jgi:hypothetical protein